MGPITRRDFINSTLVGAGASLLSACAPLERVESFHRAHPPLGAPAGDWYGFGGIGDYAASHGKTPGAVLAAHCVRHGGFGAVRPDWVDTGEIFDTVIVGAGLAGLGAAFEFATTMPASARCLILDDHPVFGGESKQNEFSVGGYRLTAPQGSNGFSIPPTASRDDLAYAVGDAYYYDRLGVPRQFAYSPPTGGAEAIRFGNDNYGFLHWLQDRIDVSHFQRTGARGHHAINVWDNELRNLTLPAHVRRSLQAWTHMRARPHPREGLEAWLDTLSCKQYLEDELGLDPAVTAYVDPILAAGAGAASDTTSAFVMYAIGLPGFGGYHDPYLDHRHSFPGGNTGFARYFLKRTMPRAIAGKDSFEDILWGAIRFAELDRQGERIRMRLSATVVRVEHERADPNESDHVLVSYVKDGRVYRLRARSVVMASGGWVNKHVVRDLPEASVRAFDSFNHAAFLVANVALNNWRFMHRLGISGCRYDGDFGFACNLRNPMAVGADVPPHDPGKPAVLSFYVPFITPGEPAAVQGNIGRLQLFSTTYADYERRIVRQMNELFAATGFDAANDIAGIVLNRWGHAYVMAEPGFFFARNGEPPAREIAARPHGRIGFGHSELQGMQHWGPAAAEGRRAFNQVRARI
ncbi:MAG: FAD-binding protein [Rhodospirillaceae bacterium]|nr:FAD-binding protein [Rhodospirillaceae bacterium]